jgi:hypothetical protein
VLYTQSVLTLGLTKTEVCLCSDRIYSEFVFSDLGLLNVYGIRTQANLDKTSLRLVLGSSSYDADCDDRMIRPGVSIVGK